MTPPSKGKAMEASKGKAMAASKGKAMVAPSQQRKENVVTVKTETDVTVQKRHLVKEPVLKLTVVTVKKEETKVSGSGDEAQKAPKVVQEVVRDRSGHCEWIVPVTKAIQNLRRKQTLHIPSWVVKNALLNKTGIYLRSANTGRAYNCVIMNPKRKLQRYLGDGWYDYLDDHRPKVNNIMHFKLKAPHNVMTVTLMR